MTKQKMSTETLGTLVFLALLFAALVGIFWYSIDSLLDAYERRDAVIEQHCEPPGLHPKEDN